LVCDRNAAAEEEFNALSAWRFGEKWEKNNPNMTTCRMLLLYFQ